MRTTALREFKVAEVSDSDLWLKVLGGRRKGIQIAVPKSGYDDDLQGEIDELERGEHIRAVLKSVNKDNTAWKISEIGDKWNQSRQEWQRAPADD